MMSWLVIICCVVGIFLYDLSDWETDKAPSSLFFSPKVLMSAAAIMSHDWLMFLNEFLGNGLSYLVNINFTFREEKVEMPSRSSREQRGIHSTWRWERVVPRSLGRQIIPQLTRGAGYITAWNMGEATQHLGHRSLKLFSLLCRPLVSPAHPFQQRLGLCLFWGCG